MEWLALAIIGALLQCVHMGFAVAQVRVWTAIGVLHVSFLFQKH